MRIGEDYPKIEWEIFGMELLEPNALIGDTILATIAFVFFYRSRKFYRENRNDYNLYWSYFFLVFGIGFFIGGLGHVFYNYFGVSGKFSGWYLGIFSTLSIELAMASQLLLKKSLLKKSIITKAIIALIALSLIIIFADISKNPNRGMIVPTINSLIGLLFALGVLGYKYTKIKSPYFKYLYWSVIILLPSVAFQGLKINISPWLDRNDLSHILLLFALFLYYKSLKKVQKIIT
jgi:Mn2+/Fe2+ NRAMP family transporter